MLYSPPSAEALAKLKSELNLSNSQMAGLFGVSDARQWRKYTGDERKLSAQLLFFAMARLELDAETIERVLNRMREAGATIDLDSPSQP
ncbi:MULTISPECIES: hypothetical protein [Ralstonia]|jgi:hypothetical protein|uniref:HTH cro/C1-type domain-containing protein n=1 Tax=Ralstonia pickettii OR214 TaxID=1264675 RepID=R0EE98_RALPI|nr:MULTISPECIES: hypothetical protein [Ralstonia]ENZ79642.1 hypothetical protein OR214_00059 [Ralstonia pickettii OR214]MBL4778395.1 XRE family transcriptional regulator [Ralstonia sp.]MCM3582176.1 XRE family transcriptional regulator [Ralstonia pickettii]